MKTSEPQVDVAGAEKTHGGALASADAGAGADRIRLIDVRSTPLSVDEVLSAVGDPHAGGIALFVGTVRDHTPEHPDETVAELEYSAHPSALDTLRDVCAQVASTYDVTALAAVHRTGTLAIGDIAVICATATGHRGEAFDATRALIDTLKAEVPIWKHQQFADGSEEWVGTP